MKLGIVTLSPKANFGGIIQAFALQTVLSVLGHDARIICKDYKIKITPHLIFLSFPRRIIERLLGKKVEIFREIRQNREISKTTRYTQKFIDRYLQSDNRTFSQIKENDYEAYVVGSDQIWRPEYIVGGALQKIEDGFLEFAEEWNVKRVAYAASFGKEKWEYPNNLTSKVGRLLKKFDAVSVRENTGVEICQVHFNVSAELVLDPTLLLDRNEYINLIKYTPKSDGELYSYLLDESPEKSNLVNRIAKDKNLKPFYVGVNVDDVTRDISKRIQDPVEKWLRGFYDASFIVTDSFHGCVFSIIFRKPFVAIVNKDRGSDRFISLLSALKLSHNMIFDINEYNDSIDYSIPIESDELMSSFKNTSFAFLKNNLK